MPCVDKAQIAGVALTTQRNVLINLDQDGQPLRPAIHWSDQRRTPGLPNVGGFWGVLFAVSGMTGTIRYLQAEAKTNWIRMHQPEIWSQTARVMHISGYLTHCLTGKFVDSTACQVAHLPFDYKKNQWAGNFDWKWKAVRWILKNWLN
jgi:sugar (pentulose or hexulose) kinase